MPLLVAALAPGAASTAKDLEGLWVSAAAGLPLNSSNEFKTHCLLRLLSEADISIAPSSSTSALEQGTSWEAGEACAPLHLVGEAPVEMPREAGAEVGPPEAMARNFSNVRPLA